MEKVKKCLQSLYCIPVVFFIATVCYLFNVSYITVGVFTVYLFLLLLLCDDVKNIFGLFLFIPYFIGSIYSEDNLDVTSGGIWVYYFIAIGIAAVSLIAFFIKSLIVNKNSDKGKMFLFLIVGNVACLLGGIIGNFNILGFLAVIGFSVVSYIFYYIALNHTTELKKGIFFIMIIGALAVALTSLIGNVFLNYQIGIFHDRINGWIGAININEASIYIFVAMVACFFFGINAKYDYLYLLLAVFMEIVIVIFCCRMLMAISFVAFVFGFIMMIIKSEKKRNILITVGALLLLAVIGFIAFKDKIMVGISEAWDKIIHSNLTGRDKVWKDAIDKFLTHPVFGNGFIDHGFNLKEGSEDMSKNVLTFAHNTPLQWLSCLGIVGILAMAFYYFGKYKTAFRRPIKNNVLSIIAIIGIELSGLVDSAAALSIFIVTLNLIILAGIETEGDTVPELFGELKNGKQNG